MGATINNRTSALERASAKAIAELKCILLVPIFALDSVVVKAQKC